MYDTYKITKPVRLIELFAGYGSQHLALTYLGVNVKGHKIVEWAVPSIQAYKDLHYGDVNTDHTKELTDDEIVDALTDYGISANYNEPMTKAQIERKGGVWCRTVYNNIKNTNNLVNISNVKATDLEITETDKYDYILTYSFPCQDLSLAGKRAGMDEDSETRSSLLWQVQRLLDELKDLNQLPQVLLMENVPQVMAQDNLQNMEKWDHFLSLLGYKSYIKNLIATDYGIPQIRNRTFMISILGEYSYTFPKPIPLELKLSDMLEDDVDEKYYLSNKMIDAFTAHHEKYPRKERFIQALKNPNKKDIANTITARAGQRPTDNFIIDEKRTKKYKNYVSWEDEKGRINTQDHRAYDGDVVGTIPAMERGTPKIIVPEKTKKVYAVDEEDDGVVVREEYQGMYQYSKSDKFMQGKDRFTKNKELADTILTTQKEGVVVKNTATNTHDLRIRKLTPKECFRLMGVKDEDYDKIAKNQSDSSLYHLAGDSIVVNVLMAIFKQLL